jgi:hypothetical protein
VGEFDVEGVGVVPFEEPVGNPDTVGRVEEVMLKEPQPEAEAVNVPWAVLEGEVDKVNRKGVPVPERDVEGVPVESPDIVPPPPEKVGTASVLEPLGEEDTLGDCVTEREDRGVADKGPLRELDEEWEGVCEPVPDIDREGEDVETTEDETLKVELVEAECSPDTLPTPPPPPPIPVEGVKRVEREREGEEEREGDTEAEVLCVPLDDTDGEAEKVSTMLMVLPPLGLPVALPLPL